MTDVEDMESPLRCSTGHRLSPSTTQIARRASVVVFRMVHVHGIHFMYTHMHTQHCACTDQRFAQIPWEHRPGGCRARCSPFR